MVHNGGSKLIRVGKDGRWDEELVEGERRGLWGQGGKTDAEEDDAVGEESEDEEIDDLICPLSEFRL